jgi:hypothetical protein
VVGIVSAYAELMGGARAGFDGICVTEHSPPVRPG